jgi:hypothetical protein
MYVCVRELFADIVASFFLFSLFLSLFTISCEGKMASILHSHQRAGGEGFDSQLSNSPSSPEEHRPSCGWHNTR